MFLGSSYMPSRIAIGFGVIIIYRNWDQSHDIDYYYYCLQYNTVSSAVNYLLHGTASCCQ